MKVSDIPLSTRRHSCAHLLAAAVQQRWPEAQFGVGPAIDNGFYYDIQFPEPIGEEDLPVIEADMRMLASRQLAFEHSVAPLDNVFELMGNQSFKHELLRLLRDKGATQIARETGDELIGDSGLDEVSLYQTGDFIDLCQGPHVEHSGQVGAFKLTRLAGAYWRGDENNPQLQRIYGLCFANQQELEAELERLEQARLRDHRRLGKALELFTFSEDVGAGLPIWLPNGTALRQELEHLARQCERAEGYENVVTPTITKRGLYERSGHLAYYQSDMYAPMDIDGEEFYLRPMNCPHHHQIYLHRPRSWREMPIRLSEYGQVFRYEKSGTLSGLMRTRGFCQNDAHIYCRHDQAVEEFVKVMQLHARYYELFDIQDYYMRLSLPDLERLDKYVDEPEKWLAALAIIREAMEQTGLPFKEAEGEAAFYGPKVDFMIKNTVGVEYAISTNQLDFMGSEGFDLAYTGQDGEQHPVYVIHRAPLGSHERFVAFLIEHYGGNFPFWLAPVQARIIPIADRHIDYARQLKSQLDAVSINNGSCGLRIEVDMNAERMQKKIRNAQLSKIPYVLIVGDREMENQTAAVRARGGQDLGVHSLAVMIERFTKLTDNRSSVEEVWS
ncbi:MAG: threonine--tRNA ligase [Pseudomonadota bacterium]